MTDDLERELRQALRREAPPAGFAERVLATAAARTAAPRRARRWALAAAASLLMAVGLQQYRDYRERLRGEAARNEAMLALRIAGVKLYAIQAKVLEINVENRQ